MPRILHGSFDERALRIRVCDVRITLLSDYAHIGRVTDLREVDYHDAVLLVEAPMGRGQPGARGVRRHPPRDLRGEPTSSNLHPSGFDEIMPKTLATDWWCAPTGACAPTRSRYPCLFE